MAKRNYRVFCFFVYCLCLQDLLVLILSIYHVVTLTDEYKAVGMGTSAALEATLRRNPISLLLAIYAFAALFFVGGLCGFHVYLVCAGLTTNEQVRLLLRAPWTAP